MKPYGVAIIWIFSYDYDFWNVMYSQGYWDFLNNKRRCVKENENRKKHYKYIWTEVNHVFRTCTQRSLLRQTEEKEVLDEGKYLDTTILNNGPMLLLQS